MELDETIVELGEKLDAWCEGFFAMLDSEDRVAHGHALVRGIEIAKELDRLKANGLTAIKALLARQHAITEDEHVASLVRGFEFASKLRHTLSDELMDTDGVNKTNSLMNSIADALDATGSGRDALAVLLEHSDARVRASAGAYLVNSMPGRVVPILREIEQKEHGNSAHFTAHWAVLEWDLKEEARGQGDENAQGVRGEGLPVGKSEDAASLRELVVRYRRSIVDRLTRIYEAGDDVEAQDRFLIIELSDRPQDYVQCVFDTSTKILCEASSGFFYTEPRSHWLPAQSIEALGRLGFSTDDSAGNFRIWLDVSDPPDLAAVADFMLKALHDGYGARANTELSFNAPLAP